MTKPLTSIDSHIGNVGFLNDAGVAFGVKEVGNKPRVSAMPYTYDIAEGNIPGHQAFRVIGYNGDVGSTQEDLWEAGGLYVFPTGGIQMEVIGNAADAAAGTGVQQVEIHYLDTSYEPQSEIVTMNGATAVPTVATNIFRVQQFHSVRVGSGGAAAGAISLRATADTPIYSQIGIGGNVALTGVWTVPKNKTAFITAWQVGAAGGNKDARFLLRMTSSIYGEISPGIMKAHDVIVVEDGSVSIQFTMPIRVPSTADIKLSVVSAAQTAKCAGNFAGWYE